jgi:hypothetical protein
MKSLTRLFWVGLKSQPSSLGSNRNRSGHKTEHSRAVRDNIAFDIAKATAPSEQKLLTAGDKTAKGPRNDPAGVTGLKTEQEVYDLAVQNGMNVA